MVLCIIFGITNSVRVLFLRFGRRILYASLSHNTLASVNVPNPIKAALYKSAIAAMHPLLQNVLCVMDSVKILLQQAGSNMIQEMYYNGRQHDHYVTIVFVFPPDRCIIACALNAPGAMHECMIGDSGVIYPQMSAEF